VFGEFGMCVEVGVDGGAVEWDLVDVFE